MFKTLILVYRCLKNYKKLFYVAVINRNMEKTKKITTKNLNPGNWVISDDLRAYAAAFCDLDGFTHDSVNNYYFLLIFFIHAYIHKQSNVFGAC